MYRKIYRLRTQVESGNIDVDNVKTLLWSILEQADAVGNKDACILTGLADKWLDTHDWQDGKKGKASLSDIVKDIREGTLLDDLELLACALAEKDATAIEKYMIEKHKDDGYTFNDIEQYRDDGIITEHFTLMGNVVIWFRDWWGEEDNPDGVINEVGFLGANNKPKVIDYADTLDKDDDHADQLRIIMDDLNHRGI